MASVLTTPGDAVPIQLFPSVAFTPLIVPEKSPAALVAPLSLITVLMMIRCAALSLLVTVQVLVWPSAMLPVQSPE